MKNTVCLLVVILLLTGCAYQEESLFYTRISEQPIKLKDGTLLPEGETESLVDSDGIVSQVLIDAVHDDLTGGYRIADMDVDAKRILMLLAADDGYLLRIAQWNDEKQTYALTDWPHLPEIYLDTFHDGDAVFFQWESESYADSVSRIMLTIEEEEGKWHVMRFTDGNTFSAEKTEDGYLFGDYWLYEDDAFQHPFMTQTEMGEVSWVHIMEMIDEYNALFLQRPALNDDYWEEVEE